LAMALLFWAGRAAAAEGFARVEGRVVKKGVGIPGVIILVNDLKLTDDTDASGRFQFNKVPVGTHPVVLTLGDDVAVHQLVVTDTGTMKVEYEVDWTVRGYEEVAVIAEELALPAQASITILGAERPASTPPLSWASTRAAISR